MANYIVTGGAGFIGSNLAKQLTENGHQVYILDDLSKGFERNIPKKAVLYKADISRWEQLEHLLFDQEIVAFYHLAAQSSGEASFDDPVHDIEANYKATYNALKLCQKLNCRRFIFASSMSVYGEVGLNEIVSEENTGQAVSYYGLNKLASESLIRIFCQNSDIKPTSLRLFNVYGPGQNMDNMKQGMVSIYMSFLMRDQTIHVKGSLDRFRDFVFVKDVVKGFLLAEKNEKTYFENINLGTGKKTTVKKLLEAILYSFKKTDFDAFVKTEGSTSGDVRGCIADTHHLKKLLNWTPQTPVHEGISQMTDWIDTTKSWWI